MSSPNLPPSQTKQGHFIVIGSNDEEGYIGPFSTVEAATTYVEFINNSQWWENILLQPLGAIK